MKTVARQIMPELPEVETTLRGMAPHVDGRCIRGVTVRNHSLRWPVPPGLNGQVKGQKVLALSRRGKYLLWRFTAGYLLMHLGMSGSLRVVPTGTAPGKHDHLDIELDNGQVVRFTDPRRFGAVLWLSGEPMSHWLLSGLGPEPLGSDFDGEYLYRRSRHRKVPIKSFIMDSKVVVGVGNIYANEALFLSGIHPRREAGRIGCQRYRRLREAIRDVLAKAIAEGGTTLRDFIGSDGKPGYFKQALRVYGRAGLECVNCALALKEIRLGGRSTVYCTNCQR